MFVVRASEKLFFLYNLFRFGRKKTLQWKRKTNQNKCNSMICLAGKPQKKERKIEANQANTKRKTLGRGVYKIDEFYRRNKNSNSTSTDKRKLCGDFWAEVRAKESKLNYISVCVFFSLSFSSSARFDVEQHTRRRRQWERESEKCVMANTILKRPISH